MMVNEKQTTVQQNAKRKRQMYNQAKGRRYERNTGNTNVWNALLLEDHCREVSCLCYKYVIFLLTSEEA